MKIFITLAISLILVSCDGENTNGNPFGIQANNNQVSDDQTNTSANVSIPYELTTAQGLRNIMQQPGSDARGRTGIWACRSDLPSTRPTEYYQFKRDAEPGKQNPLIGTVLVGERKGGDFMFTTTADFNVIRKNKIIVGGEVWILKGYGQWTSGEASERYKRDAVFSTANGELTCTIECLPTFGICSTRHRSEPMPILREPTTPQPRPILDGADDLQVTLANGTDFDDFTSYWDCDTSWGMNKQYRFFYEDGLGAFSTALGENVEKSLRWEALSGDSYVTREYVNRTSIDGFLYFNIEFSDNNTRFTAATENFHDMDCKKKDRDSYF